MVTPGRRHHRYTYDQYVALQPESPTKHEFFDGEIYALVGGSEDHSALALNVLAVLLGAVGDRPLPGAHLRPPHLRRGGRARDLSRWLGDLWSPATARAEPNATALNPLVLLEVTSDSSEEYDRGEKLEAYKMIPTLREVIIVSHRENRTDLALLLRGCRERTGVPRSTLATWVRGRRVRGRTRMHGLIYCS